MGRRGENMAKYNNRVVDSIVRITVLPSDASKDIFILREDAERLYKEGKMGRGEGNFTIFNPASIHHDLKGTPCDFDFPPIPQAMILSVGRYPSVDKLKGGRFDKVDLQSSSTETKIKRWKKHTADEIENILADEGLTETSTIKELLDKLRGK